MIDLVPSRVVRAFGSEGSYSDAVSSVNKFNARLLRERRLRLRLPFVDSQTHIIQTPTQHFLWRQPTQRMISTRSDQVALYARKSWFKRRPRSSTITTVTTVQSQALVNTNGTIDQQSISSPLKTDVVNGSTANSANDDPRVILRAGSLGTSID